MKKFLAISLSVMALSACGGKQNIFEQEWNTPYGMPPFDKITYADYLPAVKEGIKEQNEAIAAIVADPAEPTFENTVLALRNSGELLNKVNRVLNNVSGTDADDRLRKINEEASPLLSAHNTEIYMNAGLFERVKALHDADQSAYTREQQMIIDGLYRSFTRNGINLDAEGQAALKEINARLSLLTQKFSNNLLAENENFQKEFGIPVSGYTAEMTSNPDRALRERLFNAYSTRCNHDDSYDNKAVILDILRLRARKAALMGFPNWAAYRLDGSMPGNPETVDAFQKKVIDAAMKSAAKDVTAMQKIMDKDIAEGKVPAGSRIEPWDWFYYADRLKAQECDITDAETKPYFEVSKVREGLFYAAGKVYGISAEKVEGLPLYNPEVETFRIIDTDGSETALFYTDYIARASKGPGAWCSSLGGRYTDANGNLVLPIVGNVCNFVRSADGECLLTVDDVITDFHEFGHALNSFFTRSTYKGGAGRSEMAEVFSQFNEHWAFQPEILPHYAVHHETGDPIPAELVAKIQKSLRFNQGFLTGENCAAGTLDMKLHELSLDELENLDLMAYEKKICEDMGLLGEMIPRYRTTYFAHIFDGDGYSAGYYSYLWTRVIAEDAFAYFEQNGIYNPDMAYKFRHILMEKGGWDTDMALYEQFRGAQPDPDALLKARGLK